MNKGGSMEWLTDCYLFAEKLKAQSRAKDTLYLEHAYGKQQRYKSEETPVFDLAVVPAVSLQTTELYAS